MDEMMLVMLRRSTWQKAKGQLNAILEFYCSTTPQEHNDFEEMNDKVGEFIKWMDESSPIA